MSAYNLGEVIQAWEQEKMTTEQVIGQILLLLQEMQERIYSVEYRMEQYAERVRRLG
jgi:hypothetical protein